MKENFDEILASMLADLDAGKSVEEIIAAKMAEVGLNEEAKAKVAETVEFVDKINAAEESLRQAKEKGASRQEWLDFQVGKQIQKLPETQREEAKNLLEKFTDQTIENL